MKLGYLPLLLLVAAAQGASVNAAPKLGVQKFHKDWAVACDNRLWCEAVSLVPENASLEGISLLVRREGNGGLTLYASGFQSKSDRYRMLIDGRIADTGPILPDADGSLKVTGKDALRLARHLGFGRKMQLFDGNGVELGKVSLAGSQAAFRHMDSVQKQLGSQAALVNPGTKGARVLSVAAPTIMAKRIRPTKSTPDPATLVSLVESSSCREERYGVTEDTAHSLGVVDGRARALVLISCGSGAYNFASAAYIGEEGSDGKWAFSPARFDFGASVRTSDKKLQLLVNASWSPESQMLSSFAKGRGLGDCGNSETYMWDGVMFRLTSAFGMEQCRGSMEWMKLWHAEVKLVD